MHGDAAWAVGSVHPVSVVHADFLAAIKQGYGLTIDSCKQLKQLARTSALALFLLVTVVAPVRAAEPVDQFISAYFGPHLIQPIPDLTDLSLDQAYRLQRHYVQQLSTRLGSRRGFKVGMTSLASQRHFGVSEPLFGQLLDGMLLQSPARLPVSFGANGLVEADLLVRVKDNDISKATSIEELLTHLDAVIPFIELPDPLWSMSLSAARLVAVNSGARYGVLGEPVVLASGADWNKRLAEFSVELRGPGGDPLAVGKGDALLGHPLKVVFWLVKRLQREGLELNPGDLLSLGSLTPPGRPEPGLYQAIYRGLSPAGPTTVSVEFYPEK